MRERPAGKCAIWECPNDATRWVNDTPCCGSPSCRREITDLTD